MAEEHPLKPFYSVLVLAFACSTLVALAAVGLQPYQQINRTLDQKKNILTAAGIYREDVPVIEQFDVIETRVVELASGRFVEDGTIDPELYNQPAAALSDETGRPLEREVDEAGIRRLETYSLVHLVRQDGAVNQVVLPVRGKGLWSTMYAYVAIDADLNTITGVAFYEHGETPGSAVRLKTRAGRPPGRVNSSTTTTVTSLLPYRKQAARVIRMTSVTGSTGCPVPP
jgi:Na+-transporting NADH:ubiquinone oxidoreductase subunit C